MMVETIKSPESCPLVEFYLHNPCVVFLPVFKLRKEIVEVQATTTIAKKHHEEEEEEEEDEERTIKTTSLPNYLLGSLSTDFGADTSLLTSQLDLHSREEKINQIILLKVSEFPFFN
jgi:hypothetical protein